MNNTFNKVYFDNKINEVSKELNLQISKINDNDEDIYNKKIDDFLNQNNINEESNKTQSKVTTLKMSQRFNNPRKKFKREVIYNNELDNKIKQVQQLQKEKYDNFLSEFNIFRDEVYQQLSKYAKNIKNNNKIKK